MNTKEAYLALNMVPKLGPVKLRRLLDTFGSPEKILALREEELRQVEGIGPEIARSIFRWEETTDVAGEMRRAEKFGAQIVTIGCPEYPKILREIYDPPTVLYVWGDMAAFSRRAMGIVGTRKPSHYALECAKKLSFQIAYAGIAVVSGLARGIDTAAHQGALAAKGVTIAVLGSGLANLYPKENLELAQMIASSGGAVVSEFPMEMQADRQSFPMRNRIVSGCSFGLLVVEASLKSGAMITAQQAVEQGRSIYAVPGRIDQPASQGTNRLIQQGAKLVMSAQDILDDFGILFREPERPAEPRKPDVSLSPEQESVYAAIGEDEAAFDEIVMRSSLPASQVMSTLLVLEMKKLVKQLPGRRFVRLL